MKGKIIFLSLLSVTTLLFTPALTFAKHGASDQVDVHLTLSKAKHEATIPPLAFGMNTAVWDGNITTPGVSSRLKQLYISLLRWPGGSYADTFNWSNYIFSFRQFMQLSSNVKAMPLLTVNYGTGTPSEAASWVRYVKKHHEQALWEIGNEVYGNGTYQNVSWETDMHQPNGPTAYAKNALTYIQAMRKIDPNAQIGIVGTIPGVWPSGIAPYWDRTVLPIVAKKINFIVIHWYPQNPGQESDQQLLASTDQIAGYIKSLQGYLHQYAGKRASDIKIFLDETNSVSSNPGKQMMSIVNALFAAKDVNTWLSNGISNVSWWDLHNGPTTGNLSSSLYGNASYGDYGILSNGSTGEPPLNTPTASYWGLYMVAQFVQPGSTYLSVTTSNPILTAFAARSEKNKSSLMLINSSNAQSARVSIPTTMFTNTHPLIIDTYGKLTSMPKKTFIPSTEQAITVPPYSMIVVSQ